MMAGMAGRVLVWGGVVAAAAALVGLGGYLAGVGLERADKLAGVIGLFVALVGLGVSVYGLVAGRRGGTAGGGGESPRVPAPGERSISAGGDISGIASTGDGATNIRQR